MPVPGSVDQLARIAMFAGLGTGQLVDLERAAFVRRLARGQVLFVEGEPVDNLYVVRDGGLKVHLVAEHGAELLLSILGPGSVLGDVSLIDRGPRSATVTALQASELLAVPQDIVRSLLASHPAALWAVAEGLAAGVRRLTSHSAGLIFLDLPRRLAKLLLDSASPAPDGTLIVPLPVTQTDLAAMLGVSRQSLNKALSGLTVRGWIEPGDGEIRVVSADAISRFVRS